MHLCGRLCSTRGLPSVATLVQQKAKGIHEQGEYFWNATTFNLIP